jgi:hypothetical protein
MERYPLPERMRNPRIDFTVSKVTADSYLNSLHPALRELAEQAAAAFVKARDVVERTR